MNYTRQKAAAIESKVREVCPELTERYCTSGAGCTHDYGGEHEGTCVWKYIYGEIHLEHLLRTIDAIDKSKRFSFQMDGPLFSIWRGELFLDRVIYDITISFFENLENNELTDFLYKLICE